MPDNRDKPGPHSHNAKLSDVSEAFQDKMFVFFRRDLGIQRSSRLQLDGSSKSHAECVSYIIQFTALAITAMCWGVLPQQPPTTRAPTPTTFLANSPICCGVTA
jgi:hypothetical protein